MVAQPARRDADPARHPKSPFPLVALAIAFASAATCLARPAWAETPDFVTVVLAEPDTPAPVDEAASSSLIAPNRTPRAFESLPQLLAEQPGVAITRSGGLGDFATVSLRGSAPNQVVIFVDGVPFSSASVGGVDVGMLRLGQGDYAEIYRGQTPIAYPTSGIGGVVALSSLPPTQTQAGGQVGTGSFQTRYGNAQLAHVTRKTSVSLEGHGLASENNFPYWNDGATVFNNTTDGMAIRQNNAVKQGDGRLRASVNLTPGRTLTAIASYLARERGVPNTGSLVSDRAHLSTRQWMGTAFYESDRDLGRQSTFRAQAYAMGSRQGFSDPAAEIAAVATETDDHTLTAGATLTGQKLAWPWLRLSSVLGGHREGFSPSSQSQPTGPEGTREAAVAGMEADFMPSLGAWHLIPSLRLEIARDTVAHRQPYDLNQFTSTAPATYVEPVARFSIQRSFHPEIQGRANVGRYGRLPSLYERYGNTGQVLGNSELVPEHGLNADLGLRWDHPTDRTRTALDVAIFGAEVTDLIVFQRAGERIRPLNIKGARVLGVEAALHTQVGQHLRAVAQGTFTDAREESDRKAEQGHQLPLRPRWRGYARPELRDLPIGRHLTVGAYVDVDLTGQNYLTGESLLPLRTRVQFGAGVHVDAPRLGMRVLCNVENIANSPFFDLAGYPLPGRSFFLTLAFQSQAITKETSS